MALAQKNRCPGSGVWGPTKAAGKPICGYCKAEVALTREGRMKVHRPGTSTTEVRRIDGRAGVWPGEDRYGRDGSGG